MTTSRSCLLFVNYPNVYSLSLLKVFQVFSDGARVGTQINSGGPPQGEAFFDGLKSPYTQALER